MSRLAIQIAAKLYEAHDTMRALYGDGFPAMCATYQCFIRRAMEKWGLDALPATQKIVAELQQRSENTAATQAMVLAALVEMLEPEIAKEYPQ